MTKYPTVEMEVDIDHCMPNKWNPNAMTPKAFENLKASIKLRGFQRFITVREVAGMYEIMDGEHRWKACKELGFKTIKVHNLGQVDDIIAKEITLNFNNIHGEDDILKRASILKAQKEAQDAGQTTLFSLDERQVQEEIELLNFNFNQYKDTKLNDKQADEFAKVIGSIIKLQNQLKSIQNIKGNDDAWLLVQQGMTWCEMMIEVFKKYKKIEVLPGQKSLIDEQVPS